MFTMHSSENENDMIIHLLFYGLNIRLVYHFSNEDAMNKYNKYVFSHALYNTNKNVNNLQHNIISAKNTVARTKETKYALVEAGSVFRG